MAEEREKEGGEASVHWICQTWQGIMCTGALLSKTRSKINRAPAKATTKLYTILWHSFGKRERESERERRISSVCVCVRSKREGNNEEQKEHCELSDDMWIREIFPYYVIIHCLTHSGTKCS